MNQIEEPGKAKRRGKRGGKKHKDAAAKLAEVASVENVVEGAILPGKNEATLQSKVEITAAQADEKKQLPHLSYDTKSYFCTLESKLDDPEALEDKDIFITALFREIDGQEIAVARDFDGSRILEKIMPLASDFHLRILGSRMLGYYSLLFTDKFSSHVCQSMLVIASDVCIREVSILSITLPKESGESIVIGQDSTETLPTMIEIVQRICDEISPEFQSLISDRYASHVIRALLCILSGKSTADVSSLRSKSSIAFKQINKAGLVETRKGSPDAFKGILATLVDKVLQSDRSTFRLLVVDPVANPVVSLLASLGINLLLINKGPGIKASVLKALHLDDSYLRMLIRDRIGSHLVEQFITESDSSEIPFMEAHLYEPENISIYAKDPIGNFVLQAQIKITSSKSQLKSLVESLIPEFKTLLSNRGGVVEKLFGKCREREEFREEIVKGLCDALYITEKDNVLGSILALRPPQDLIHMNIDRSCTLHGSLILQHILKFSGDFMTRYQLIESSVSKLSPETVKTYATHKMLSRSLEAMFTGLVENGGSSVCQDIYACRVIEAGWSVVGDEARSLLREVVKGSLDSIMATKWGRIMHAKLGLGRAAVGSSSLAKKRSIMGIFDDDSTKKAKKSKKLALEKEE